MAQDVENMAAVSMVSDPLERTSMQIGENTNEEGHVTDTVVDVNSEATSASNTQDTRSQVNLSEPAAIKVPSEEPEIVVAVDRLSKNGSLSQVDQGTSGCSISSFEESVSVNCLKNNLAQDLNKNVSVDENDSAVITISGETTRSMAEDCGDEKVCRICHLSSEQSLVTDRDEDNGNNAASKLIQLGCGCKDELGIAHVLCAEAWFKLRGNR